MIELENVKKIYPNGTVALDNVNLKIEDGEFVFVVGASGAGKSTLMKLLMREEKPTDGRIIVDGQDIGKLRKGQIPKYRRGLGIVFQDFRLFPKMTVYENIAFAMRVTGWTKKEIDARVPLILHIVALDGKQDRYPSELSGGEQQRVALGRALSNNPSYIIADEPTGNIDNELSREIMSMLIKIHKMGKTVIVVTHERGLVRYFGERVVTINGGKVVSDIAGEIEQ